jgi:hypothetical protein
MPANEAHAILDGTGRAEEDRPSFCLEFVNMNTSSPAEKRRNQLVIRSTAMKNFRRRQQSQRTQAKEASRIKEKEMANKEDGTDHKEQYKEARKEWNQDPQDVSSEAVDDWISQTALTEPLPESRTSSSNQNDSTWDIDFLQVESSRTSNDFFALSSPLTHLGGGRIDPFRIYPTGHVGPHVHELIDHCEFCPFPKYLSL